MTPQAFSYPTVANNGMIYCAPYGLTESIDFMLKFDPNNYTVTKIKLDVDNSKEKWQRGIVVGTKIYSLNLLVPLQPPKLKLAVNSQMINIHFIFVTTMKIAAKI